MLSTRFFRLINLFIFLSALSVHASAQRNLRCPKPKKEKNYNKPLQIDYIQANVFGTFPLAYKYKNGFKDPYFKSIGTLGFATNFQNYFVLSNKVELLTEIMYAMNQQGMDFKYQDVGLVLEDRRYVVSTQYRFSAGLSYNVSERLSITVAPSIIYNVITGYGTSGNTSSNANGTFTAVVNWGDNEEYDESWYPGASLYARINVTRRFYASFMTAVDFAPSSPSTGSVTLTSNGIPREHRVNKNPYLMHLGIGLGFRIYQFERRI